MKIHFLLFGLILQCAFAAGALSAGDVFCNVRPWRADGGAGGDIRVKLTVDKVCDDAIIISILKDMTPFLQTLKFQTSAKYEAGKYVFSCIDNWDNFVCGQVVFNEAPENSLTLFFDCEKFSDHGKNLARLYGDTMVLQKYGSVAETEKELQDLISAITFNLQGTTVLPLFLEEQRRWQDYRDSRLKTILPDFINGVKMLWGSAASYTAGEEWRKMNIDRIKQLQSWLNGENETGTDGKGQFKAYVEELERLMNTAAGPDGGADNK